MASSRRNPETFAPSPKDFRPELGIARMTGVVDRNEKAWWLLQVRLTPYTASRAGLKYDPLTWQGTPLVRVIWVNRDGHLAEYQEFLDTGEEVQVPCCWELNVEEAIYTADRYSALGIEDVQEWLWQAQAESTLIEDIADYEAQKTAMALNRSHFGAYGKTQRNGFPAELRERKFRESNVAWRNA